MILDAGGHCEFCNPSATNQRRRLAKQDAIDHYLRVNLYQYPALSIDRVPAQLSACGDKERPDFLWDTGLAVIILEVDENQHMDRPCECEQTRMVNVSGALAAERTLWIRYNPDKYSRHGERRYQTRPGGRC
jgi:hypothetical protein